MFNIYIYLLLICIYCNIYLILLGKQAVVELLTTTTTTGIFARLTWEE